MIFIGLDLAGSPKRDTGFCLIELDSDTNVKILHTDEEILSLIETLANKNKEIIVGIDAPLSLPFGRTNIEERNNVHFRQCDLELRKLGIRFFPITLGPMRTLTKRGMELKQKILKINPRMKIIEVYPGATYDQFKIERKDKNSINIWHQKQLKIEEKEYTQDELDGITCAITAKLFFEGKAHGIGNEKEGLIIIPKKN